MIKFFRKIRQQLVKENKISKYILYAIGEIFLVLIGILLALAISDWNNDRVDKQSEIKTLTEIKKGITTDLDNLTIAQKRINNSIINLNHLQTLLEKDNQDYTKDLDTLFGVVYGVRGLSLNSAFYEDLKSSGLNLIKDENVRLQIVQLFENNYKQIADCNEIEWSINEVNRPYYLTHFYNLSIAKSATPNDFNFVWQDSYFHNIVDYRLITLEGNQVKFYSLASEAIEKLTNAIDIYLSNHNN